MSDLKKSKEEMKLEKKANKEAKKRAKAIKKARREGRANFFVYLISAAVMLFVIFQSHQLFKLISSYTFLPEKYLNYLLYALLGVNGFFGLIAFLPKVNNLNKILQTILCAGLAYAIMQANIIIPTYKGQLERNFIEVPTEGDLAINFITLNESAISDVKDLENVVVGLQTFADTEYQDYALKVVNHELGGKDVQIKEYEDIYSLSEALLNKEVEVIMMNESYVDIITENDDFLDFEEKTKSVYQCIQKISFEYDETAAGNITKEPFIVLIGANDDWYLKNLSKTSYIRTDVNIVAVVNPNTKQVLLVSLPRDSYVPLDGNTAKMDKLTHSSFYGGLQCWKNTIQELLGIKCNYYVRVNFSSMYKLVDSVGGIEVNNPYKFTSTYVISDKGKGYITYTFNKGIIHLDGNHALGYCRERKKLAGGDKDRIKHQAIVIQGLLDKVTSVAVISHFGDLFQTVSSAFITNMKLDKMYALVAMQLEDMATWDVQMYALSGSGGLMDCWSYKAKPLSCVKLYDNDIAKAKKYIKKVMDGETVSIKN